MPYASPVRQLGTLRVVMALTGCDHYPQASVKRLRHTAAAVLSMLLQLLFLLLQLWYL